MTALWVLLFLAFGLFGLYIMVTNPLAKKYQSDRSLDIGAGGFLIAVSVIYFTIVHLIPAYDEDNSAKPCGKQSPQAICYGLDPDVCTEAWESFDAACDEEVRPIKEKRPSALLYPLTYKCHAQKFDKITFYNRRKSDTPFCQEYFKKID